MRWKRVKFAAIMLRVYWGDTYHQPYQIKLTQVARLIPSWQNASERNAARYILFVGETYDDDRFYCHQNVKYLSNYRSSLGINSFLPFNNSSWKGESSLSKIFFFLVYANFRYPDYYRSWSENLNNARHHQSKESEFLFLAMSLRIHFKH